MALDRNISLARMISFLNEEVKEQILLEIAPILHIGQEQGGYFGSSRQILCFIDFLGSLYKGYDETQDPDFKKSKGKRRKISYSSNAVKFIEDVMGEKIDPYYKLNGEKLFRMYRHGLVHLYQPKTLLLHNGNELVWFVYKGSREKHDEMIDGIKYSEVRHMGIIPHPKKKKVECLTISINCLYYDLIQAIDIYLTILKQDKTLQAKFISTANAIRKPEIL